MFHESQLMTIYTVLMFKDDQEWLAIEVKNQQQPTTMFDHGPH